MDDRAAMGRSSVRRGITWQREVASIARQWFPHADHSGTGAPTAYSRSGDITGVGDRILECTVEPLSALAKKLGQAHADAIRSGVDEFYVVKKAKGYPASEAYVVTRLGRLLPLLAEHDRLLADNAELSAELEARR